MLIFLQYYANSCILHKKFVSLKQAKYVISQEFAIFKCKALKDKAALLVLNDKRTKILKSFTIQEICKSSYDELEQIQKQLT